LITIDVAVIDFVVESNGEGSTLTLAEEPKKGNKVESGRNTSNKHREQEKKRFRAFRVLESGRSWT